jgi:hypothetical protein
VTPAQTSFALPYALLFGFVNDPVSNATPGQLKPPLLEKTFSFYNNRLLFFLLAKIMIGTERKSDAKP